MPDTVYCTRVTATGGRHGSIRSDDGLLDLKLALPKTLSGKGDATNPEQLFAGGYAACFENALLHVSRKAGRRSGKAGRGRSRSRSRRCLRRSRSRRARGDRGDRRRDGEHHRSPFSKCASHHVPFPLVHIATVHTAVNAYLRAHSVRVIGTVRPPSGGDADTVHSFEGSSVHRANALQERAGDGISDGATPSMGRAPATGRKPPGLSFVLRVRRP